MPLDFGRKSPESNPASSIKSSARSFFGSLSRSLSSNSVARSSSLSIIPSKGNESKNNISNNNINNSSNSNSNSSLETPDNNDNETKKTIYLIRHAESEENVKMHGLQQVGTSLIERKLPCSKDLSNSFKFLGGAVTGDTDSHLSEGGKRQVTELHQILETERRTTLTGSVINDVDVIAHSPLVRARETCYGAFGLDPRTAPFRENVVELSCLEEATPWETAVQGRKNTVHKRIAELYDWIDAQTEASTIALVGHSEYFMILLGISRAEKFWNCDVWKVQYCSGSSGSSGGSSGSRRWTGLERRHRLASSKPMGMM
mmetsp:Transcript_5530/g.13670  ORF Transcript_5530/g.13670 Transcript_5530/m.13670 type:complete len:316 (+) Transcript_5530:171-1118(+)